MVLFYVLFMQFL